MIINNGQAAIDFASGSLDLLSRMPSTTYGENRAVENLKENITALRNELPAHP